MKNQNINALLCLEFSFTLNDIRYGIATNKVNTGPPNQVIM